MAKRTIKRMPFSVPSPKIKDGYFNQVEFKGICDDRNDVTIDQQSYSDALNLYVDDGNMLTSRPPLKFSDNEAYIVEQWMFGDIGLRLHRIKEDENFIFLLKCFTHEPLTDEGYPYMSWTIPIDDIGYDFTPVIKHVQIEDKIFTWFGGVTFSCFFTTLFYFDNALKYLYFPVHKLVINGIESELETKNFLTETYRKRHQYSAMSSVNFERLTGRKMIVNINGADTQNKSNHLYDITVEPNQEKMLVYPYSPMGSNFFIDVVQTPRATVTLRYSSATRIIEVSFDGKSFRPLPMLEDTVGTPQLTKDGLWVVMFTRKRLAKCRIVASELSDFIEPERVMSWETEPYMRLANLSKEVEIITPSFVPQGHFETIDQFSYVFKCPSVSIDIDGDITYLYTEYLSGSRGILAGHNILISWNDTKTTFANMIYNDNIKVHFRYVAPTQNNQSVSSIVTIAAANARTYTGSTLNELSDVIILCLVNGNEIIDTTLYNNNRISIFGSTTRAAGYIQRLSTPWGYRISDEPIQHNDEILFASFPYNVSMESTWSAAMEYNVDDVVSYKNITWGETRVYRCRQRHTNVVPQYGGSVYWEELAEDATFTRLRFTIADTEYYLPLSWKYGFMLTNQARFKIQKENHEASTLIERGDKITLTSFVGPMSYSPAELVTLFGNQPPMAYKSSGPGAEEYQLSWLEFIRVFMGDESAIFIVINSRVPSVTYEGTMNITRLKDSLQYTTRFLKERTDNFYMYSPYNQFDIISSADDIRDDRVIYKTQFAYNETGLVEGTREFNDGLTTFKLDSLTEEEFDVKAVNITQPQLGMSSWFKFQTGTENVLTDKYLRIEENTISLPQNGELYPLIDDTERQIINNDNLVLALSDGIQTYSYDSNIHRLTDDGTGLSSRVIQSGDLVSCVRDAITERDYLRPGLSPITSNRYRIQKVGINTNNEWVVMTGSIKTGDLIRLISYENDITLPVGNAGNPYDTELVIPPIRYPSNVPGDWTSGDAWPSDWPTHPPLVIDQGEVRLWSAEHADPLTPFLNQPVTIFGVVNLFKRVRPLSVDSNGVWYSIDGSLWTSETSSSTFLELDEYINAEVENIGSSNTRWFPSTMNLRRDVPKHTAILDEHYMSFVTASEGLNLLQITATRRDEYRLFTKEGRDFLIYLPKINEQRFAKEITNLHTLSENDMGVFTQDEIWYIRATTVNDQIAYTKPVKSKIPAGCRAGSEIITALDGKLIVFTTPRGVTALSPQDFIATTEQTLTYLSDNIQALYQAFYNNAVHSTVLLPSEFQYGYRPEIKIVTYKYWIIFHRYMDRIVLAFDTRNSTWWRWETPYPIKSMIVDSRLHLLMHIDYNPIEDMAIHYPPKKLSLLGIDFTWSDREVDNITYYDDVIPYTLNGYSEWIEDKQTGGRRRVFYAEPMIKWSMLSQRLHFGKINNYKQIKAITMIAKGDSTMTAKLTTKVYRDFYHPEKSEVMEIAINNLTTFVRRMNIMHFLNFQYKLETDINNEQQSQLKLDSLGIKYEVKEEI